MRDRVKESIMQHDRPNRTEILREKRFSKPNSGLFLPKHDLWDELELANGLTVSSLSSLFLCRRIRHRRHHHRRHRRRPHYYI